MALPTRTILRLFAVILLILCFIDVPGDAKGFSRSARRSSYSYRGYRSTYSRYGYYSSYRRSIYRRSSAYRSYRTYTRYSYTYGYRSYRTYRSYRSYRSGRYSYYRRYTYRSYRSYTYRAPTRYSRYSYGRRYTSRTSNYYRTYRAYPVRYHRSYSPSYGYYYNYYRLYYYFNPYNGVYLSRQAKDPGLTVCKNYEANVNGSSLGVFACPMPFEPNDFNYCCGERNAEYCCKFISVPGNLAGVIIGCIILGAIVIAVCYFVYAKCIKKPKKPEAPPVTITGTSGRQPRLIQRNRPATAQMFSVGPNQPSNPTRSSYPPTGPSSTYPSSSGIYARPASTTYPPPNLDMYPPPNAAFAPTGGSSMYYSNPTYSGGPYAGMRGDEPPPAYGSTY